MVPSVTMVLQRFKTDWAAQLQPEAIHAACEAVGYTAWRDRLLNPVITVQLFLLQILHGNTACRHLPHLAGFYFSASAYCQARAKLPIRVLEYLLERFGQSAGCEYEWNRKLGSCITLRLMCNQCALTGLQHTSVGPQYPIPHGGYT
jgi:hypothetical protein